MNGARQFDLYSGPLGAPIPKVVVRLRPSTGAVLWAALLAAACLAEDPSGATTSGGLMVPHDRVSGHWVIHVGGGIWGDGITLATVESDSTSPPTWKATEAPSRLWDGSPAPSLGLGEAVGTPLPVGDGVEWRWECAPAEKCTMRYTIIADTARGEFVTTDSLGFEEGFPVFGVRVRPSIFALPLLLDSLNTMSDSIPTVLLWLADDPAQDLDFISRLRARGIPTMLAIPSYFVGTEGRPGWPDLYTDRSLGIGFAAHSRRHSSQTLDGVDFVGEVLGSMSDLDSMGFRTTEFVEPGNWPETIRFDSASKFRTWRGSLMRTFVSVFASQYGPAQMPEPVSSSEAFGFGHWTVSDGVSDSTVRNLWRQAQDPGKFTVFGVHTWKLPTPDALDWFLDSLSVALHTGRIRMLPSLASPPSR